MKQIRALRANGITLLVSSVITAVCVGVIAFVSISIAWYIAR